MFHCSNRIALNLSVYANFNLNIYNLCNWQHSDWLLAITTCRTTNAIIHRTIECHLDFVNVDISIKIDISLSKWMQCWLYHHFTMNVYVIERHKRHKTNLQLKLQLYTMLRYIVNIGLQEFCHSKWECIPLWPGAHFAEESPVILVHYSKYEQCFY